MPFTDLVTLQKQFRTREQSPSQAAEQFLSDAARRNNEINAFVAIDEAAVRKQAQQQTEEFESGRRPGGLHGVPIALKDLIDIKGQITTAASRVLASHLATQDAEVIRRLRDAGAVLAGKTNLHEFAYGGSGVISSFGPARNPWNTAHITGGSSSGSAAAVAAGLCPAAIGTDTAGSIRLPASFCGLVGFKPTYNAVSAEGIVPLAISYDHVGPITRTVADARSLFEVLSGTSDRPQEVAKLRIGLPEAYFYRDLESEVGNVISSVLDTLAKSGHHLQRVDFAVDEDRTFASFESYTYHAKWVEQVPELYQPETLRRIKTGEKVTKEAAAEGKSRLDAIRKSATDLFSDIDILLTPTVPVLPPALDDVLGHPDTLRHRELVMLRNTRPFNVLGIPAISLPWDLSVDELARRDSTGCGARKRLRAAGNCRAARIDCAMAAPDARSVPLGMRFLLHWLRDGEEAVHLVLSIGRGPGARLDLLLQELNRGAIDFRGSRNAQ